MNTKDLQSIISQEIDIYNRLLQLEEQKKEAIVAFKGDMLFSVSKDQEALILSLEKLEKSRQQLIKTHAKQHSVQPHDMTLKGLITLTRLHDDGLLAQAKELRVKIEKFARLHEANKKLINDNLEFFNVVLSSLRKAATVETGYGPEGLTKRSASGAVLMNTTV